MIYQELNKYINIPCLEGEEWRPIKGYEESYKISNYGRVKRLAFTRTMRNQVTSWSQHFPEKIYKLNLDSSGYPQVVLNVNDCDRRVARCHRLVAEHFFRRTF